MLNLNYLSNSIGEQIAVVIPIDEFKKIEEFIDQFEDIQEYQKAKKENLGTVSFDEAFYEIEGK
jgi:hypothetical protein